MNKTQKLSLPKKMTAVVIINTFSRRGEKLFFKALDSLQAHNITVVASYPVRRPSDLPTIIKEALSRSSDIIIVGGGDGTISSIVDQFAYKDVVLGLLPLGTGNSFIRTLGIPLTLTGAIRVIRHGKVVKTDLGRVDGDYFANVVSLGFAADVARATPRRLKRMLGPIAYGVVGLKYFFTTEKFQAELTMDGTIYTIKTHSIIIANGSVYGISPLRSEADVDSGKLLVLTMDMMNRWQHLKFWLLLLLRPHKQIAGMQHFLTSEVHIKSSPIRDIDIDGDSLAKTPVTLSVAPSALKVMVPQSFHEH